MAAMRFAVDGGATIAFSAFGSVVSGYPLSSISSSNWQSGQAHSVRIQVK